MHKLGLTLAFFILALILFSSNAEAQFCGDLVCDAEENETTCPLDCLAQPNITFPEPPVFQYFTETNDSFGSYTDAESNVTFSVETMHNVKKILRGSADKVSGQVKHVEFFLDGVSPGTTTVTVRGLKPNTQYHLYKDSYENHNAFIADSSGSHSFEQDTSLASQVWIQSEEMHNTVFVRDIPECAKSSITGINYGNWDANTRICTLTGNVNESVIVDVNNTVLDCGGYSVYSESTSNCGIRVGSFRKNVVVKNCVVNINNLTFSLGILANGIRVVRSTNVSLFNNTVRGAYNGFSIELSSFVTANSNIMDKHCFGPCGGSGFNVESSNNNTFTSNVMKDISNGFYVYVILANNNTFISIKLEDLPLRAGIQGFRLERSHYNNFTSNTAKLRIDYRALGFYVLNSQYNFFTNNFLQEVDTGFFLLNSSYSTLKSNSVLNSLRTNSGNTNYDSKGYSATSSVNNSFISNNVRNVTEGFYVGQETRYSEFVNNSVQDVARGFVITGSIYEILTTKYNVFRGNVINSFFPYAQFGLSYGFGLYAANSNSFYDNLVQNGLSWPSSGFFVSSGANNSFVSNTVYNSSSGLRVDITSNNTFILNRIENNDYGFYSFDSNFDKLDSNQFIRNNHTIYLWKSHNNIVKNNTIILSFFEGISLSESSGNLIYNNYFNTTRVSAVNARDTYGVNFWNITKTPGTNIVGGPFIAGNFWGDYAGTDTDGDKIGDNLLPYTSNGGIVQGGDFAPLIMVSSSSLPTITLSPPALRVFKWGNPRVVPGRVTSYYISLMNNGEQTAENIEAVEYLEPWFNYTSASPIPSKITAKTLLWNIPSLLPGETKFLSYQVRLANNVSFGSTVHGPLCAYPGNGSSSTAKEPWEMKKEHIGVVIDPGHALNGTSDPDSSSLTGNFRTYSQAPLPPSSRRSCINVTRLFDTSAYEYSSYLKRKENNCGKYFYEGHDIRESNDYVEGEATSLFSRALGDVLDSNGIYYKSSRDISISLEVMS